MKYTSNHIIGSWSELDGILFNNIEHIILLYQCWRSTAVHPLRQYNCKDNGPNDHQTTTRCVWLMTVALLWD